MKIIVMMKQVANKDAILRINKDVSWIEEGDLSFEVSESDGYALEEALRVREKLGDFKGSLDAMERYLELMKNEGPQPAWSDQRLAELRTKASKQ